MHSFRYFTQWGCGSVVGCSNWCPLFSSWFCFLWSPSVARDCVLCGEWDNKLHKHSSHRSKAGLQDAIGAFLRYPVLYTLWLAHSTNNFRSFPFLPHQMVLLPSLITSSSLSYPLFPPPSLKYHLIPLFPQSIVQATPTSKAAQVGTLQRHIGTCTTSDCLLHFSEVDLLHWEMVWLQWL